MCHNRQHVSNNCVAMLYTDNITLKCHDEECKSHVRDIIRSPFKISYANCGGIT